jgi:hypothetical protein
MLCGRLRLHGSGDSAWLVLARGGRFDESKRGPPQRFGKRDEVGIAAELHTTPHLVTDKPTVPDVVPVICYQVTNDHGDPQVNSVETASVKRP